MTAGRKTLAGRRPGRGLPTCRELRYAPELAILTALENVVDLVLVALVAARPELHPRAGGRDLVSTAAGDAADALIGRAQSLVLAIAAYRAALHDEHDDWPF